MLSFYLTLVDTEEEQLTLEQLYHTYRKQMHAVALRILRDPDDAEDAVQDAFLGMAVSLHCVPREKDAQQKAYVLTVVKNAAFKILSKQQQRQMHENIDDFAVTAELDLFDEIVRLDDYSRLLRMISSLPSLYQEILMMRYVLELKPKEIGQILQRKVTTVQQLARGKKMLVAAYLKEEKRHD